VWVYVRVGGWVGGVEYYIVFYNFNNSCL